MQTRLKLRYTSTFTSLLTIPHIYTNEKVNNVSSRTATSSDISTAISGKTDNSTTYPKNRSRKSNKRLKLQHWDCTVIVRPQHELFYIRTWIWFATSETLNQIGSAVLVALTIDPWVGIHTTLGVK